MYSISLLPSEYKSLQVTSRKKELSILILATVMGALAIILLTMFLIAGTYDKELDSLIDENQKLESKIAEYKYIEILQSQVTSMEQQILQLSGTGMDWGTVITNIGNTVPPKIGLTSFVIAYPNDVGMIIIKGHASDHDTVGLWMEELQKLQGLSDITCKLSAAKEDMLDDEVEFELNIPLAITVVKATGGGN